MRGSFNQTHGAVMGGHAVKSAMALAGLDASEIEDVYMGCGMPEGATGNNIARESAIWAGCPVTTAGITISRYCSSGLNAIATAAQQIMTDGTDIAVGSGGRDPFLWSRWAASISATSPKSILLSIKPAIWRDEQE